MKVFWLIIVALAIVTVAICLPNRHRGDRLVPGQRTESTIATSMTPAQTQPAQTQPAPAAEKSPWGTHPPATLSSAAAVAGPSSPPKSNDDAASLADDLMGSYDAQSDSQTE